jgi:type IV secretion system protein TrbI
MSSETPEAPANGTTPDMGSRKVAPESLELRAKPRPVARINRRILVGVIGVGCLLLAGLVLMALNPPSWRGTATGPELITVDRKAMTDGLGRLPSTYEGLIANRSRLPAPADPPVLAPGTPVLKESDPATELERAERTRLTRLGVQARESTLFFRLQLKAAPADALRDRGTASAAPLPATPQQDLTALTTAAAERLRAQTRKLAFLKGGTEKDIYNPHGLQRPASPYQLLAGTIIAASLVTGLNSDLPGFVIAQVTEPVYDTITGRFLLIPQGSRLIGKYDSVVAYGQRRALVVWQRIIRPDGSSIVIDNLPAIDTAGYAGLTDEVDLHTWQLLKGIGLATVLGVGSSLAFGQGSGDSDLIRALRESTGQTTNRAGQRLIERELNVQPTLTVRPGWPLRVIVHKDIILSPVRN